jgi:hypothetical protein
MSGTSHLVVLLVAPDIRIGTTRRPVDGHLSARPLIPTPATVPLVATIRQRRPGIWEIRVFTGRDQAGRPTQFSKTVRGTEREAQRVAASLEARPPSTAGGRTVADVVAALREINNPGGLYGDRRYDAYRQAALFAITPIHFEETSAASLEAASVGTPLLVGAEADVPYLAEYDAGYRVLAGSDATSNWKPFGIQPC